MNGAPLLEKIAKALAQCRLEAVLIGNAAAALHGAPITTMDFDFMFRKTAANLRKLKRVAVLLQAQLMMPFHPPGDEYYMMNDDEAWRVRFVPSRTLARPCRKALNVRCADPD